MGGLFSKTDKTPDEIHDDIDQLNKITNNELFYKKTGYKFYFEKTSNFFKSFLGGKNIICLIVK